MLAAGCLMPLVLLAVGGAIGGVMAGNHGGIWGSIIGFASGCGILLCTLWGLERLKNR